MIRAILNFMGIGQKVNLKELANNGAIIVDVRTKQEYSQSSGKSSINIPLDQLSNSLNKIKNKENTIITCCASGMRSASAKAILKQAGYSNVHNGGPWHKVDF